MENCWGTSTAAGSTAMARSPTRPARKKRNSLPEREPRQIRLAATRCAQVVGLIAVPKLDCFSARNSGAALEGGPSSHGEAGSLGTAAASVSAAAAMPLQQPQSPRPGFLAAGTLSAPRSRAQKKSRIALAQRVQHLHDLSVEEKACVAAVATATATAAVVAATAVRSSRQREEANGRTQDDAVHARTETDSLRGETARERLRAGIADAAMKLQWKAALALMEDMLRLGIEPDASSCTHVFQACASAPAWHGLAPALGLLRRLQLAGAPLELNVYSAVLSLCAASEAGARHAFRIFKEMEAAGLKPDLPIYGHMLSVCERDFRHKEALELFRAMRGQGFVPTVQMYNKLIALYRGLQFWNEVPVFLQDMEDAEVTPSAETDMLAMSAYAHAGQKKLAFELLHESWRAGRGPCQEQSMAYVALADCCARENDWQAAMQLLSDIRAHGLVPHELACRATCRALRKHGMDEEADELERAWKPQSGDRALGDATLSSNVDVETVRPEVVPQRPRQQTGGGRQLLRRLEFSWPSQPASRRRKRRHDDGRQFSARVGARAVHIQHLRP